MAHVLARLRNWKPETIKARLLADTPLHTEQGLHLERLWQNVDDPAEVLFLFRVDDLGRARQFIDRVHGEALAHDPKRSCR